jgi:hypothetical protein
VRVVLDRIRVAVSHAESGAGGFGHVRRGADREIDAQLGVAERVEGLVVGHRRIIDRIHRDGEVLGGAGVDASVRGATVVHELQGDGGDAERVQGRGVGQHAGRGDRRARTE